MMINHRTPKKTCSAGRALIPSAIALLAALVLTPAGSAQAGWNDLRDFRAALAKEYRIVAEEILVGAGLTDDRDHERFLERAAAVEAGRDVDLYRPTDWLIPAGRVQEALELRAVILAIFENGSRRDHPKSSAAAQASYDCLLEQLEENFGPDYQVLPCRARLNQILGDLAPRYLITREGPVRTVVVEPASEPAPAIAAEEAQPAPAVAPMPERTTAEDLAMSFEVFFDFDSAEITAEAQIVLSEIVERARRQGLGLSIIGHTDTAGSFSYNERLALRRARAVQSYLLAVVGVDAPITTVTGVGERDLAVPTADGVREARNRRAVINLR